jgi:type I restriction enzyme R subunit
MTFNAAESYQSQVPAIQALVGLGYVPLSQRDAEKKRGRLRNVLLDNILVEKLLKSNSFNHRGKEYQFDLQDAHEALRRLKPTPDKIKGLKGTNQDIYDLLVLGTTITKTIEGDSKSYSFKYIDWETPASNVFHVTPEVIVERTSTTQSKRLDLVCFVNGIPFVAIENKRPTESLKKAESQLIGYQGEDNIPHLFHFAQLLMTMNRVEARYATVGATRKYWQTWRDEEDQDADIAAVINNPLSEVDKKTIFSGDFSQARSFFDALAAEGLSGSGFRDEDVDIFVLVDESHRTQTGRFGGYGDFAKKMRRMLPSALQARRC